MDPGSESATYAKYNLRASRFSSLITISMFPFLLPYFPLHAGGEIELEQLCQVSLVAAPAGADILQELCPGWHGIVKF